MGLSRGLLNGFELQGVGRLLAQESGSTLAETAVSTLVLLTTTLSVIGFARVAYAKHFVAFAARQGTRYASVRGSSYAGVACATVATFACQATAANVRSYVLANVPLGLSSGAVTVTTAWPGVAASGLACLTLNGTNSPGCNVQVSVTYAFRFALPFLPVGLVNLHAVSVAPVMH